MARPAMMGETATTGARQARSALRTPGRDRIGSMLMNGLDGQITTAVSAESASADRNVSCGWASPWKTSSWTTGSQRRRTK